MSRSRSRGRSARAAAGVLLVHVGPEQPRPLAVDQQQAVVGDADLPDADVEAVAGERAPAVDRVDADRVELGRARLPQPRLAHDDGCTRRTGSCPRGTADRPRDIRSRSSTVVRSRTRASPRAGVVEPDAESQPRALARVADDLRAHAHRLDVDATRSCAGRPRAGSRRSSTSRRPAGRSGARSRAGCRRSCGGCRPGSTSRLTPSRTRPVVGSSNGT